MSLMSTRATLLILLLTIMYNDNMSNKSKIDLAQLKIELRNLHYWQPLYKLLKKELTAKGYWRLLPRGKPSNGFKLGWGKHRQNEPKD